MKPSHYLCLLSAALLASCHPDAEQAGYDLTGKYTVANTITAAHPIAMYTVAGQVGDPAVLSRYLARHPSQATYFSPTDVVVNTGGSITLTFRANNRATLVYASGSYTDSLQREVTDRKPTSFLLQNVDSFSLNRGLINPVPCDRSNELVEYIRGTDWGRKCRLIAPFTGYKQGCRVRLLQVVGVRGSQLYIPYYSWVIQAGGCVSGIGGDWNTFNPAVVSHLLAGDTVVIQERERALSR